MTRDVVLSILKAQKPILVQEMGVRSIGLFGSLARGEADEESDIDILVDIETPSFQKLMAIKILLENKLGRPVDLHRKGPHLRKYFLQKIESEIVYA